jgi:hypothetical protein
LGVRAFWAVMTGANCCSSVLLSSNSNLTTFSIRTKVPWILISPWTMILVYWAVPSSSVREFMLDAFRPCQLVCFLWVVMTRAYRSNLFLFSSLPNCNLLNVRAKVSVLLILTRAHVTLSISGIAVTLYRPSRSSCSYVVLSSLMLVLSRAYRV